jgi:hypothetical protein
MRRILSANGAINGRAGRTHKVESNESEAVITIVKIKPTT